MNAKKISERAIEFMIERHKTDTVDPKIFQGFTNWFDYNTANVASYPSAQWTGSIDILQALDEYQASQKEDLRASYDKYLRERS